LVLFRHWHGYGPGVRFSSQSLDQSEILDNAMAAARPALRDPALESDRTAVGVSSGAVGRSDRFQQQPHQNGTPKRSDMHEIDGQVEALAPKRPPRLP
jgi:hypothetical protein